MMEGTCVVRGLAQCVCELKLKGQCKWPKQFCKWCRGPVYIECTFTGDRGDLKT